MQRRSSITYTFLLLLSLTVLLPTLAAAQGVTDLLTPGSSAEGCATSRAEPFGLLAVPGEQHPSLSGKSVSCSTPDVAQMSLEDGVLTDARGRIGSVVSNRQFQFDGPPAQAGAVYTGGWSVCPDGRLALGVQDMFYSCRSDDCEGPCSFFFFFFFGFVHIVLSPPLRGS